MTDEMVEAPLPKPVMTETPATVHVAAGVSAEKGDEVSSGARLRGKPFALDIFMPR